MKKKTSLIYVHAFHICMMHLKNSGLVILCTLLCIISKAQNAIEVSGIITDDKGAALSNASVIFKGTKSGTTTDNSGRYLLKMNGAGTLIFSYAGYQSKEVLIDASQTLNVSLITNNATLNDVIVTGYSKQSKRDVTGSVSTVSADIIAHTPVTDIGTALEGRVAGVSVDQQGEPGSTSVIRIRGFGTNGNNNPLYVIDGVQIRGGKINGVESGGSNLINPNDIETLTILKDPSTTALYGAEGSNGVIVITTKSGKIGAPKLEFSSYES